MGLLYNNFYREAYILVGTNRKIDRVRLDGSGDGSLVPNAHWVAAIDYHYK